MTLDIHNAAEQVGWINGTDMDDKELSAPVRQIASALSEWVTSTRRSSPSVFFDRSSYREPENFYAQLALARSAVATDDVVGGAADVTEGLIFQGAKWEARNPDDADVFNQISRDLNLDDFLRSAYRELFTASQLVVASWWSFRSYQVRGYNPPPPVKLDAVTDPATGVTSYVEPRDPVTNQPAKPARRGTKRRKTYDIFCPTRLTILDSTRIVPIGNRMWGEDRLAWQATSSEMKTFQSMLGGDGYDETMAALMLAKYEPGPDEEAELSGYGIDTRNLIELRPDRVFRHTLTKAQHERWPSVRMRSIFKLLDLKQQLTNADRVNLVGAANYILLVKKGTDQAPAHQAEVDNLKENFKVLAKVPVIISDHRLEIEIITPAVDTTLDSAKYDTLDRRILSRLLGSLTIASSGQRNETTITIARMVARLLENRRQMLKRALEGNLARAIVEANPGKFEDEPNLAFTPRQVQLDADQQLVQAILAMRARNELSRETTLEFFNFDQDVEAQRRINEEESGLDEIFGTKVPFDSPANGATAAGGMPPGAFGAQGGRPAGGGQPKANNGAGPSNSTN